MATRTAKKDRTTRPPSKASDPLERSVRGGPRCECEHENGRCRQRATHRVSAICVAEGCRSAVHVYLVCAMCKDTWLHNATHDPSAPELRVTPL